MSIPRPVSTVRRALALIAALGVVAVSLAPVLAVPLSGELLAIGDPQSVTQAAVPGHLVVSEVMTGGTSASDEFIEIYNPTAGPLPIEGLELVYVTATGTTVTRKATWPAGSAPLPAGGHFLIVNDAGVFSTIGDQRYANGLAAAGGSVALRIIGATSAVDAVGWGTAASTWLETRPAPAPTAGSSLERLPGGIDGSGQDMDDNLLDFVVRGVPDPQNAASAPILPPTPVPTASPTPLPTATPLDTPAPTATPEVTPAPPFETPTPSPTPSLTPVPTPTPSPTPSPTPVPTPTPTPQPISIATARSLPDGSGALVEGVALTDGAFADGGGYLWDGSAGIAVLVSDGTFARGALLRVRGIVDDRYAQRTLRAAAADVQVLGSSSDPVPGLASTGAIDETREGRLVKISGLVTGGLSVLSAGTAVDIDDGSGSARVIVWDATGIDLAGWVPGAQVTLVGVVGQRDSSGTGLAGYRAQPRDAADVVDVLPPATATPSPTPTPPPTPTPTPTTTGTPSPTPTPTGTPSPTPGPTMVTIAAARAAAVGAHLRIRGVVTLPSGLLDPVTAVIQDATGGILLRLGDTAGSLALGEVVELDGIRSTKAGMLSLRVTLPVIRLGAQGDPTPVRRATGRLGESEEARLIVARGAVASSVLRSTAGNLSFSLDDGSGSIRVTLAPGAGISAVRIQRGAWIEIRGVLGQDTTAREPLTGYRIWPRASGDVVVVAPASNSGLNSGGAASPAPAVGSPGPGSTAVPSANSSLSAGPRPILALALPTTTPNAVFTETGPTLSSPVSRRPQAAALLGIGLAMTLVAGLLASRGRRLAVQIAKETEMLDERRILPPT